jgi:hypothetical protein
MSKRQRKKRRAQQRAKQKAGQVTLMDSIEKNKKGEATAATHGTDGNTSERGLSDKGVWNWIKNRSSFTDWCIVVFTGVLAGAAIYQFIIMGNQLDEMRQDERAWMAVKEVGDIFQFGKPIEENILFNNTGKTPAKHVEATFRMEILKRTEGPTFNYSDRSVTVRADGQAVFPNLPIPMGISSLIVTPGTESAQQTILTQDFLEKYDRGDLWYSVEGRVTYDDVFHHEHWTTVCYVHFYYEPERIGSGPPGAKACADYNNTDD